MGEDKESGNSLVNPSEVVTKENAAGQNKWMIIICVNICLIMLSHMMYVVYSNAVVRTLERRFALTSSQTGFLASCNDIMHICLVVFIGYFSSKSNKPRIMCVTVMFTALSAFLMASPHFFLHDYQTKYEIKLVTNNHTYATFCESDVDHVDQCIDESSGTRSKHLNSIHPAYIIFVISQLISGIGSSAIFTLSVSYMDQNAPKDRSSFYLGIVYSMFSFGPLAGLILGAICLRLPESFTGSSITDASNSNFIGCWWLGYLISGISLTITGIPLWFYPNQIMREKEKGPIIDEVPISQQIKGFPKALMRLLSNKAYTINLINVVAGAYIIGGIFSNVVRYIEIHFGERAFVGAMIAGLTIALAGAVGSFSGGAVMAKCRMKLTGALKLMMVCSSILALSIFFIMMIDCPQPPFHTYYDADTERHSALSQCNADCGCSTSRKSFQPICSEENISYFSPCIAGCTYNANNTYHNCSCLNNTTFTSATQGPCKNSCTKKLIIYSLVMLALSLSGSFARVPATMVSFRIVGDNDKTFALGFNSLVMNLFGFIPAPIIYGYLIDKSCILWERTCDTTGTCLVYNADRFRNSVFGLTLVIETIDIVIIVVVFLLVRRSPILKNLFANSMNHEKSIVVDVDVDENANEKNVKI